MLGYEEQAGSMVHLSAMERLLHPTEIPVFHRHLQQLSEERTDRFVESEFRFRSSDGTFRWLLFRDAVFDRFPDGRPKTVLCTAQDVSRQKHSETALQTQNQELERAKAQLSIRQKQLEEANVRLGDLAMTDAVTGLKNRRAYQERLDEEVERAQRYKLRLALLLADIDRFKVYNDTYGHPEGDRALKGFGKVLTEVSRRSDTVARFGGEEFCLILPNTGAEEAARLAERIRANLKGTEFGLRGMTSSFGCAEVGAGKDAKERLVADADRALYQSKHEGRDRVTVIKD
jgi:diguanylate cyclase (GGDEF)-like protein/PAS domain S-box-containing protein